MWSGQPLAPQISKRKIRTGVRNKTRGYIRVIHTSLRFTSDLPETRIFLEIRTEPQKRKGRREGGSLGSSTHLKTTVVGHSCEGAGERGRPGRLPVQGQQPARTSIPIKFLSRNAETEGKTKE